MNDLSLVAVSAIIFASTDVDDLFVLVAFFADSRFRRWHVVAGQVLGIASLVALSLAAALAALAVPPAYVGLLGVAPLVIGVKKLWGAFSDEDRNEVAPNARPTGRERGEVLTVAAVTIANGGDNIGIYAPLFATQAGWQMSVTIAVFAIMTLVWCLVAGWLVNHPMLGKPIRRYGHRVLPFVLIGLGGRILYETGSFDLLRRYVENRPN
ncbi:MAG: cadmium resistance transporter [Stellaceae bacterium]